MDIIRWSTPKSELIIFFAAKHEEALYSQQKQDQELTVAQIMNRDGTSASSVLCSSRWGLYHCTTWEAPPMPRAWYQVELPVLYSSFPLAIYFTYGNANVSALLFQFVPPFPCCIHKCVFYVCVSISAMFPSSLLVYF